jgi:hypothetical protein
MSSEIFKSYIWSADVEYTTGAGHSVQFLSAESSITPRLLDTFMAVYRVSGVNNNEPVCDDESSTSLSENLQITAIQRKDIIYGDVGSCHRLTGRGSILRLSPTGEILDVNVERAEELSGLN